MVHPEPFFRKQGSGTPMILLHGFPLDQHIWDHILPDLARDYTVYTLDLPGLGQTPPNDFRTMEELANWLHEWIEETIGESVILVGHSMGGYIAMEYVRMFADELKAIVLFHSHVFGDTPEKKHLRGKAITFVKNHGTPEYLKTLIPDLFTKTYRKTHEKEIAEMIDRFSTASPEVISNYLEAMRGRSDRSALLDSLPVPILFLAGKGDAHAPYAINVEQATLAQQSQIIPMQNVAHMGMMEDPSGSVDALLKLKEWINVLS